MQLTEGRFCRCRLPVHRRMIPRPSICPFERECRSLQRAFVSLRVLVWLASIPALSSGAPTALAVSLGDLGKARQAVAPRHALAITTTTPLRYSPSQPGA